MERKETEELREELEWQGQKEKEADLPPPPLFTTLTSVLKSFAVSVIGIHTHTFQSIIETNGPI